MTLSVTQTFFVTAFLMAVGTFVLVTCGAFLGYASAQLQNKQAQVTSKKAGVGKAQWFLVALVATWFGVALAASTGGFVSLELVLPFALAPIIGGTRLSFTTPVQALLKEIPTHWFIYLQVYRVAGFLFIVPYFTEGLLTRGFALNAGAGDVLTGIFALPVAYLVFNYGRRYKRLFAAWTAFGVLDLVVAFASAAYFGFAANGAAPRFPVTTIPLFFGPPLGILLHIITLRNFQLRRAHTEANSLPPKNAAVTSS